MNRSVSSEPLLSGASGIGVADGSFAAWRRSPVPIAGTWNDNFESHEWQWSIREGFEFGAWLGDIDVAVGAIYQNKRESWSDAARGAYDDRWRNMLGFIEASPVVGTIYIRFAHEFNGDWYPWSLDPADVSDFVIAWNRFRALQREYAPRAKLVFSPNVETTTELDWRAAFPGFVDVMGVDYYNNAHFVNTHAAFWDLATATDQTGAPAGVESHRQFAQEMGLPFSINEWGTDSNQGDATGFLRAFRDYLTLHAGSGPGKILYEIYYNLNNYALYPSTAQPNVAALYKDSFHKELRSMATPGYVLTASAGDYIDTTDKAQLDLTGDIEIIVCLAADDWADGGEQGIVSKNGPNAPYNLILNASGALRFEWYNGSFVWDSEFSPVITTDPGISDGDDLWVRVTFDADNGSSQHVVTWYYSLDPPDTAVGDVSWTLWETDTDTPVATMETGTGVLSFGAHGLDGGFPAYCAGKFYVLYLYDAIGGSLVADPDFRTGNWTSGGDDNLGNTWTLQGNAAWVPPVTDGSGNLLLLGVG